MEQREVLVKGQQESFLSFDLITDTLDGRPYLVLTVHGPESPLCMRFAKPKVGELKRVLEAYHREMGRT